MTIRTMVYLLTKNPFPEDGWVTFLDIIMKCLCKGPFPPPACVFVCLHICAWVFAWVNWRRIRECSSPRRIANVVQLNVLVTFMQCKKHHNQATITISKWSTLNVPFTFSEWNNPTFTYHRLILKYMSNAWTMIVIKSCKALMFYDATMWTIKNMADWKVHAGLIQSQWVHICM